MAPKTALAVATVAQLARFSDICPVFGTRDQQVRMARRCDQVMTKSVTVEKSKRRMALIIRRSSRSVCINLVVLVTVQ
jgi:hypothetical protein